MHTAKTRTDSFATAIWAVLVVLTLLTWGIGENGGSGSNAMLALLLIALIKGQMVANYFMGLRHTRIGWRVLMLCYFMLVGGLVAFAFVLGAQP